MAPDSSTSPETPTREVILDTGFIEQLHYLKRLKKFIIAEGLALDAMQRAAIDLGRLSFLSSEESNKRSGTGIKGRTPTTEEWLVLDDKTIALSSCLDEALRKKFQLRESLHYVFVVPYVLIGLAVLILLMPIGLNISLDPIDPLAFDPWSVTQIPLFTFYVAWLLLIGALGSAAFIVVNALGIHVDPLVDVGNRPLLTVRILAGGMFALILTLPFGYQAFHQFYLDIRAISGQPEPATAMFFLMPFLLGFSTSLVLTILNRLVASLQTFFGIPTKP